MTDYRIDELARIAGTTTRNVRAYQDRGLLPPPRRQGRVGIYTDAHLARLKLVGSLLERGYATAQISELLTAWETGKDIADVLGLEQALGSRWTDEIPAHLAAEEVADLFADAPEDLVGRLVALGVLRREGEQYRVPSPQLLNAVLELLGYGFPLGKLVDLYENVLPALDEVARLMAETGAAHIIDTHGSAWLPDGAELNEFTGMLQRLRQLATSSVQGILGHALERNVQALLGEHIARVIASDSGGESAPANADRP
ncbi:MerR family transcriptional regulator [Kutzneria viridogrisea]|uniref:MerR family transcription regulator n=2 Tax=Kutzneria TaxID=43356 RepID=W5W7M3_9PSEU|nr:MerR family transcriptional regulator [Kutzneria albida]AHH96551.1 MerR family transcription regulator [Kutzneria albida DSM 43870]MBA8928229.1 DNA-binding transcriptional MerR regulator [Kutzneria viridogrisea]